MHYFKKFIVGFLVSSSFSLALANMPFVSLHVANQTAYPLKFNTTIYYTQNGGMHWKDISMDVPASAAKDYTNDLANPQLSGISVTVKETSIPCIPISPAITTGATPIDDIKIFQHGTFFYCEFTPSLV